MSRENQTIGSTGENIVCAYLEENGYKIIERNYANFFGELDIIAKSPDKTLVFFEVKSSVCSFCLPQFSLETYPHFSSAYVDKLGKVRQCSAISHRENLLPPEIRLNKKKVEKIQKIGSWYANKNSSLVADSGYRFDGVGVLFHKDCCSFLFYKNIVV